MTKIVTIDQKIECLIFTPRKLINAFIFVLMNRLKIIQPSILLAPYVEQYWFVSANGIADGFQRFVPIGCVGLTFNRETPASFIAQKSFYPQSYISGQMTLFSDLKYSSSFDFISIILKPAGAMKFLNAPMFEFYNQHVPIDSLDDIQFKNLEMKLMETASDEDCISIIEKFLLKQASRFEKYNFDRLDSVIKHIHSSKLGSVNSLSDVACLSYKQFYRIFTNFIGLNPSNYLRIYRLKRVLYLLRFQPNTKLDELAFECGYYDKSHLLKDFKEYTGCTPTEYLLQCSLCTTSNSLFHSAFIDLK